MRQRKKIKYVQKQPPDNNISKQQHEQQSTSNNRSNQQSQPFPKRQLNVENNNMSQKSYLISSKPKNNQQFNEDNNKYPRRQYQKPYHQKQQTKKREYDEKKQTKRYRQYPQKQDVPRYIAKQSSHSDQACIICSQQIRRRDHIWTCSCCCISMHLKCIKQWIKNINQQKDRQAYHIFNWKCPQCNYQYNEPMPKYYCYCGKHMNPEYDRDLEAHSCGQICNKKRGNYCPHPCQEICHRGKCKPCDFQGIIINCQCGKSQRNIKCSEERMAYQCGKKCQKILNCHKHKCEKNCHTGPCQPCKKKKMTFCYCGNNQDIVDCQLSSFSCQNPCSKPLDCKFHKCEQKCHTGKCNTCHKTPALQKMCPCGKYQIQLLTGDPDFRKSCEESIPVCGMPCGKKLECGHVCPKSCHQGFCSNCKVIVQQKCSCGNESRKIECFRKTHEPFKCELICKKKRSCGIHVCNEVCCRFRTSPIADNHPCQLNCTKILNCQKHQCGQPCHIGLCKKCPVIYSQPQPCPCGKTFMKPPILCGTLTPQCENVCDKQLPCGHKCQNICHYGNCKCYQQVKVLCRCSRQNILTTCGRQTLCLNKCQLLLTCEHKCDLQCHKGTCIEAHKQLPCRKQCTKTRKDCHHLCQQICHQGSQCQAFPCQAQILVKCDCGHRQAMTLCGARDNHLMKKSIVCNKKCQNLKRFDVFYKNKQIYYPGNMVQFAFKNYPFLQNLQARLQKFILHSEQNFIEIQFKFQDAWSKILLTNLFENHYHLNTHFYRQRKYAGFTLMQTQNTMIPKPILSQYAKLIAKGTIKQTNLPFEYTISFQCEQRQKSDMIIKLLKNYLHKYYSERNQRTTLLHFWNRQDGQSALEQLQNEYQTYEFKCSQNIIKQEEQIKQEQIVEVQMEQGQAQIKMEKMKPIEKTKIPEPQDLNKQEENIEASQQQSSQNTEEKKTEKQAETQKTVKKIPKTFKPENNLIIRRGIPSFKKNDYPQSKENVQDIYLLDQDELYGENIDWPKFVRQLCEKKMGPQASQWRIRALLFINSFHKIEQSIFHRQFSNITTMYNKDKESAMRILQIQRIQNKSVKSEMDKNGIYLSNHQPQILSYLMLYNYLATEKIPIEFPQIITSSRQYERSLEIIKAIQAKDQKRFYQHFINSDYVFACALIPFVDLIRQETLEEIIKGIRIKTKDLYKYLLFESQSEFLEYAQKNQIVIESKQSKSIKQMIYFLKSGVKRKQYELCHKYIQKFIFTKRDKKHFLKQPEQLYKDQYFTRSFFAFGDFNESLSQKYINSLIKLLKERQ